MVLVASIPTKGESSEVDLQDARDGIIPQLQTVFQIKLQGVLYSLINSNNPITWKAAKTAADIADSFLLVVRSNPEAENVMKLLFGTAETAGFEVSASWVADRGSVRNTHIAVQYNNVDGELKYTALDEDSALNAYFATYEPIDNH
ncbi:unnamed protein product [Orchesella dallaii]|uniref:Uncharacterized protein n=1 Tax=Orchesella dallaii TaxID=48710 RepID=A0ABP1QJ70_9HEXA